MPEATLVLWLSQHTRYAAFCEAELRALLPGGLEIELDIIGHTALARLRRAGDVEPFRAPPPDARRSALVSYPEVTAAEASRLAAAAELELLIQWAHYVASRSVLVKLVGLLYGSARSLGALLADLRVGNAGPMLTSAAFAELLSETGGTFSWWCENRGRQVTLAENVACMNEFRSLFSPGHRADLQHAGVELALLREWRPPGEELCCVARVLARVPAKGRVTTPFLLADRPVLGPTSLDTDISFLMCNLAAVRGGDLVLDPFCGTGGLLIAAASLGAICFGSDIDARVLRGWRVAYHNKALEPTSSSCIFANFDFYSLPRPDVARANQAAPPWRSARLFDAIVTDPPYGIRASIRDDDADVVTGEAGLATMYAQMVAASAGWLRPGGRLVFLLPLPDWRDSAPANDLIQAVCAGGLFEQQYPTLSEELGGGLGRACIALRRTAAPQAASTSFASPPSEIPVVTSSPASASASSGQ